MTAHDPRINASAAVIEANAEAAGAAANGERAGYVALMFLNGAGKETRRDRVWFRPSVRSLGNARATLVVRPPALPPPPPGRGDAPAREGQALIKIEVNLNR